MRLRKLSSRARGAIREGRKDGDLAISDISLYEIAWLEEHGRIELDTRLELFLKTLTAMFRIVPISSAIARTAVKLPPPFPKDPMDRIIAATAIEEGKALITADKAIRASKLVAVRW